MFDRLWLWERGSQTPRALLHTNKDARMEAKNKGWIVQSEEALYMAHSPVLKDFDVFVVGFAAVKIKNLNEMIRYFAMG